MLRYGLNDGWMRSFAHMWPDDYRTARKPCHTSKPNPSTSVPCCTASAGAAPHRGARVWMPLTTVSTWSVWWLFDNTGITHKRSTAVGSCFGTASLLILLSLGGRCQGSLFWHSSIWAEFAEELAPGTSVPCCTASAGAAPPEVPGFGCRAPRSTGQFDDFLITQVSRTSDQLLLEVALARLLCLFCWLLVADVRGVCFGTAQFGQSLQRNLHQAPRCRAALPVHRTEVPGFGCRWHNVVSLMTFW